MFIKMKSDKKLKEELEKWYFSGVGASFNEFDLMEECIKRCNQREQERVKMLKEIIESWGYTRPQSVYICRAVLREINKIWGLK